MIYNRWRSKRWLKFGHSLTSVVLAPWQFSSFNASDPNVAAYPHPEDQTWLKCCEIVSEPPTDLMNGALYYFNPKVVKPDWAQSFDRVASIGNHDFYKERIA